VHRAGTARRKSRTDDRTPLRIEPLRRQDSFAQMTLKSYWRNDTFFRDNKLGTIFWGDQIGLSDGATKGRAGWNGPYKVLPASPARPLPPPAEAHELVSARCSWHLTVI